MGRRVLLSPRRELARGRRGLHRPVPVPAGRHSHRSGWTSPAVSAVPGAPVGDRSRHAARAHALVGAARCGDDRRERLCRPSRRRADRGIARGRPRRGDAECLVVGRCAAFRNDRRLRRDACGAPHLSRMGRAERGPHECSRRHVRLGCARALGTHPAHTRTAAPYRVAHGRVATRASGSRAWARASASRSRSSLPGWSTT